MFHSLLLYYTGYLTFLYFLFIKNFCQSDATDFPFSQNRRRIDSNAFRNYYKISPSSYRSR